MDIGPALFITFEGGEGSGKSTQIEHAAAFLRSEGRKVVVTREPGGTELADAIRALILSGDAKNFGPEVETALFAAARADHVAHRIQPALLEGWDVLCDRFADSTRVYQGGDGQVSANLLSLLEDAALQGLRPDLTLVLDVPASVGLARAATRRGSEQADRFEEEDARLHERRRRSFLHIAEREPERVQIIDANKPIDVVSERVAGHLRKLLARQSGEPAISAMRV